MNFSIHYFLKCLYCIFASVLVLILLTCGKKSLNGDATPIIPEASATIGPSGGTVEVTNTQSSLFGTKVEIPAGALSQDVLVTINNVNLSSLNISNDDGQSTIVELCPTGTTFQLPVKVVISFKTSLDTSSSLGVFSADSINGDWIYMSFVEFDIPNKNATLFVSHFSDYGLTEFPKRPHGTYNYYIDNTSINSLASATIDDAIMKGALSEYYGCGSWNFKRVYSIDKTTSLIFQYKHGLFQTDDVTKKTMTLPAAFALDTKPGEPNKIFINSDNFIYEEESDPIPNAYGAYFDLSSLILHEFSHFLGIATQGPNYDANGLFSRMSPHTGKTRRNLSDTDKTLFKQKYPDCYSDYSGDYSGSFSGNDTNDDYGSWAVTVNHSYNVSGTGISHQDGPFSLSGSVTPTGDITLSVTTSGSTTLLATFSGSADAFGNVSGTWINSYWHQQGTFTGGKI